MNTTSLGLLILLPLLAVDPALARRQHPSQEKLPPANPSASERRVRSRRVVTEQPNKSQSSANTKSAPTSVDSPAGKPPKQSNAADREKGNELSKTDTVAADVSDSRLVAAAETPQKHGPNWLRLQLNLAEERIAADNKIEALAVLNSVLPADVFDPTGYYNVGNALVRLGDLDRGVQAYRKAIDQRNGNYSRALNNLGVILLRQGRLDEAYDALFSALKLENFHYAEGSYNLGRLFEARGERNRAVREWRRALAVDPHHTRAANALASIDTEIMVVNQAQQKTALGATIRRNSVAEQKLSAASSYRQSMGTLSVDAVSYDLLQRARDSSEHGKLLEAAKDYNRMLARLGGYFPPANLELGYVLLNLKRSDEALVTLRQVMERDGARYPGTYYHVARLYESKGELLLAEETFVKAANFYKEGIPDSLLSLSRVREKLGDFKAALVALEQYIRQMEQRQTKPAWADQALLKLRQKTTSQ